MFQAVLRHRISIRRQNGPMKMQCRCILVFECELPFKPSIHDCFYVGEDEEDVKMVHYDITEQRFDIECGGSLCENEGEVQESIKYAISKGWTVYRMVSNDAQESGR